MAMGRNERGHGLGAGSPGVLMRRLRCIHGELDVDVTYAPRPEYGLIHPILEVVTGGIAARGGASRLLLSGAFTQAFGSEGLDASSLMLAITGFLPGDDPRMKATVDAIAARLTDKRGLVYRYLAHDGLAGEEGTFLLCTFWLAHAQALAGKLDQAIATFGRAAAAINDLGLLAEEVDPGSGEMIGNFPQAFSHIGLINAAWAIAQAQERSAAQRKGDPRCPQRSR
jgi:GH15 family glucan-1,4-alpha-glucosidase